MTNPLTAVSPQRKGTQLEEAYEFFFKKSLCAGKAHLLKWQASVHFRRWGKKYQAGAASAFLSSLPCMHDEEFCAWLRRLRELRARPPCDGGEPSPPLPTSLLLTRAPRLRGSRCWSPGPASCETTSLTLQWHRETPTHTHAQRGRSLTVGGGGVGLILKISRGSTRPPTTTPLTQLHTHTLSSGKERKKNGCKLARTCACKRTCALGSHAHFLYPVV